MDKYTSFQSHAAPLAVENVDTDQIIPARFLKVTDKAGIGNHLFQDWRYNDDGSPKADFILNQAPANTAQILVAGNNFGCGSSREHAPWALLDFGIRCVVAPSFADIFYNNCFKNGLLPVVLPRDVVEQLMEQAGGPNHVFSIDLAAQTVTAPDGKVHGFDIDEGRKASLLAGLDEIGESLQHAGEIKSFEEQRKLSQPWLA